MRTSTDIPGLLHRLAQRLERPVGRTPPRPPVGIGIRLGALAAPILSGAAMLLLASATASAQWRLIEEQPPGLEVSVPVARVRDQAGDSLRVYRDPEQRVIALLTLHSGFDLMAGCPTLAIDDQPPVVVDLGEDRPCALEGRSARFLLGRVEERRVRSSALLGLMNGTRLRFRFRLRGPGYHEVELSLRRSKQALRAALGGARVIE